ncbi:MAG: hypothetical protein LBJ21_01265 [Acidobacteriota bacterium]|jgi:hypothetical protein|nr:hypothetical protein [Acidobacteriota bacterium]
MIQAYEGYFENGQFCSTEGVICIPDRRRVFVTILDEPPIQDNATADQLAAMDEFIAAIKASDEEVPEFERIKFTRETDL